MIMKNPSWQQMNECMNANVENHFKQTYEQVKIKEQDFYKQSEYHYEIKTKARTPFTFNTILYIVSLKDKIVKYLEIIIYSMNNNIDPSLFIDEHKPIGIIPDMVITPVEPSMPTNECVCCVIL